MSTLRFTRAELLEAIEARRSWAEHLDAQNLAKHLKDEKAYLAKFRAACREALKWDYETAKVRRFNVLYPGRSLSPDCPRSLVAGVDRYLNTIGATRQKSFSISVGGAWSGLFDLLTRDETVKDEMC